MHRINQRNMPLSTPPRAGVGVAARPSTSGAPSAAATLESSATSAASFLKLLANEKRLLVLCALVEEAEMSVGVLAERAGLSQSALSQHLSRMRAEGLLAQRRDGLVIYYRIADARAKAMLERLHELFCDQQ